MSALSMLERWNTPTACIHVGLRPSSEDENHLFSVSQLSKLIEDLEVRSSLICSDLAAFKTWLEQQNKSFHFNIAWTGQPFVDTFEP